MPSRSIRTSLLGWFGLLLTAVLLTFGTLLYSQARSALWSGIDASLEGASLAILGALDTEDEDGWELDLSDDYLQGMTQGGYFGLWDDEGRVLRRGGTGAPDLPATELGWHQRNGHRELRSRDDRGVHVVVGRSVDAELAELATLRWTLIGTGLGVLALGILGGAFLARRCLAPVERVSRDAEEISARDLTARLGHRDRLPKELRGLVDAFNGTIGRLEEAFDQQARLTADASHELRTPVSVLRAQAELALRKSRSPEEYREALETCLRAAERMSGIVEGLLTLARFDAGKADVRRESVLLAPIVTASIDLLRGEAESLGVAVVCHLDEGARTQGDPRLLAEVVTNLVSNGIRYNRVGGRLTVRLTSETDDVTFSVSDTGPGIPEASLPRLFDRFYRVDRARSSQRGGIGLGLAICQWIINAHAGSIEVESETGVGSTFVVRLPKDRAGLAHTDSLA